MDCFSDIATRPLPFSLVTTRVTIAGRAIELRRPESADALLELISEEQFDQDDRLPYWAEVWPSSRVLAQRVAALAGQERRLLELGCGVGLVSIAAAQAGFDVVASDYYQEAVEFTDSNARLNGQGRVAARLIDWRDYPQDLGLFDVIAASDVLYERPNAALVAAAIDRSLAPQGVALISDPGRQLASQFPPACEEFGLRVENIEEVPFVGESTSLTVYVYKVRRAAGGGLPSAG